MLVERWTFSKALLSGLLFFWESALFLPAQPKVMKPGNKKLRHFGAGV